MKILRPFPASPFGKITAKVKATKKTTDKKKPLYFDYSKSWKYVHKRMHDPKKCESNQFRTDIISKQKGIWARFCCPGGSRFSKSAAGCVGADGKKRATIIQAFLHDPKKFKVRYPEIWKEIQRQIG